jgi:hypothetical protein
MNTATREPAAVIGRRIGIALFWSMALFVAGASTRSVVAQLYGSGLPNAYSASVDEARCAAELRTLEEGLLRRAGQELGMPRDPARTSEWLAGWDRRHAQLAGRCGSLEETRLTLFTLRTRIEAMLNAHTSEHLPLTERIDSALERVAPRSSQRTPSET